MFAHPDDESRIVGGTLALAASRGAEVSLYCATRGEAGDPRRSPTDTVALRENELDAACATLGVSEIWLDEFPDGGLATADNDAVVARMVRFLRATRPQAVVTFGPDGHTGHPDHVAAGRLAEAAFAAAGDPQRHPEQRSEGLVAWQPGWLYHTAVARSVAQRFGWTGPAVADEELVAVDVTRVLPCKRQAAAQCHASQWALSPMPLADRGDWAPWSVEYFRPARTGEAPDPDPVSELGGMGTQRP